MLFARVAGVLLLAVPFVPLERLSGGFRQGSAFVGPVEWVLGVGTFGVLAWLLAVVLPESALAGVRRAAALAASGPRRRTALLLAVVGALLLLVSTVVFEHGPRHVDSVVQLFQAKILATGAVAAPAPPADAFFVTPHMILDDDRWYSQYPPGHAALLALGVLAGAPWLVPIALSLAAAAFLWRFIARAYDESTARLALVLLALAPFFWFMGASFMNHVSALAALAAFLYAFARWEAGERPAVLAAAGAALGVAFLSRPLDAVAVGAVFAGVLAADAWRERRAGPLLACGAGFVAVASLYLAWNAATTGHPLRPGYIELWGSAHGIGFHESPWGEPHTPSDGLGNELLDLALLNVFLFEWPFPALWPLAVAATAGWLTRRWDGRLLAAFLAVPAVYFFYWHRDTFLGPRFLYVTVAFAIPLTARALIEGATRLRGKAFRPGGFRPVRVSDWALLVLLLSTAYAVAWGIPARFLLHATGAEAMEPGVAAEARAAGIDRGLVFVAETWGSRVIAQLRGLGVRAPVVEIAYRESDLCELDRVVRRARAGGWSGPRLEAALDSVRVGRDALVFVDVGGGPTTRFRPGSRLSPECLDEIRYDQGGYTIFVPHLPENDPGLNGPIVVARDLRGWNADLTSHYPGLEAWLYRGGSLTRWTARGDTAGRSED